jgi:hypothetical protein
MKDKYNKNKQKMGLSETKKTALAVLLKGHSHKKVVEITP